MLDLVVHTSSQVIDEGIFSRSMYMDEKLKKVHETRNYVQPVQVDFIEQLHQQLGVIVDMFVLVVLDLFN